MPEPASESKERLEFLWKVHAYTNEYIRFAEQKAGLVLAVQSGLLAALYAAKVHQAVYPSKLNFAAATVYDTFLGVTATLAFLGLVLGIVFALLAVIPRLWTVFRASLVARLRGRLLDGQPRGLIFWKQVLAHADQESYWQAIEGVTEKDRGKAVAHHVYALAGVANAKFDWVQVSIAVGAAGALFAVLTLFSV